MTAPLRRDAERNRLLILGTARRLNAERGLGVSHDDIARAAGVGVGTVYRRFPTKDDLTTALFTDALDAVAARAQEALAEEDAWAALRRFLGHVVDRQGEDRGLRQLLGGHAGPPGLAARAQEQIAPVVAELLRRSKEASQVDADVTVTDVALVPLMVSAVVEASPHGSSGAPRRALAIALRGLSARPQDEELEVAAVSPEEVVGLLTSGGGGQDPTDRRAGAAPGRPVTPPHPRTT